MSSNGYTYALEQHASRRSRRCRSRPGSGADRRQVDAVHEPDEHGAERQHEEHRPEPLARLARLPRELLLGQVQEHDHEHDQHHDGAGVEHDLEDRGKRGAELEVETREPDERDDEVERAREHAPPRHGEERRRRRDRRRPRRRRRSLPSPDPRPVPARLRRLVAQQPLLRVDERGPVERRHRQHPGVHPDRVAGAGLDAEPALDALEHVDVERRRDTSRSGGRGTRPRRCGCSPPGTTSRSTCTPCTSATRRRASSAGAPSGTASGTGS